MTAAVTPNRFRAVTTVLLILAVVAGTLAGGTATANAQQQTNLPIPRMVSLKSDEANVRTGPGVRYPKKWVYRRKDLPLEVIAEYEAWRKVRDWEGAEGWVHRAMLSSRRTVVVIKQETTMRKLSADTAPAVARLASGVVARVDSCGTLWCLTSVNGYEGFLKRTDVWGLYEGERVE